MKRGEHIRHGLCTPEFTVWLGRSTSVIALRRMGEFHECVQWTASFSMVFYLVY